MSFSIDANVLLYASNADCAEHDAATRFMQRVAAGPELCCMAWPVLMAYLRIATHPSIFPKPMSGAAATHNVTELLTLPHVRTIGETDRFWPAYMQIAADVPVKGNLVPDAQLAALLQCNGVKTLYSRDRDFRKFDFLEVRDPLASGSR